MMANSTLPAFPCFVSSKIRTPPKVANLHGDLLEANGKQILTLHNLVPKILTLHKIQCHLLDTLLNSVIGGIGLESHAFDRYIYEIGYWLNENFWNEGIMTAALKEFVHFIWDGHKYENMNQCLTLSRIVRIEAHVAVTNKPSVKLLEKVGFKKEGMHRKAHRFRDGSYGDSYSYALIKDEY